MKKKIAMLFPYAPSYREPIYQLMDKELDVDWFFCGNATRNMKMFNYHLLKHVDLTMKEIKIVGSFTKYKGLDKLKLEQYDVLIVAGVYQNLSEWKIALKYGRCKKKPALYFWTHGMYGKESKFRLLVKKFLYHSGQGLFLYGNYAKELMKSEGFKETTLHVIHNSLDYENQLTLRSTMKKSIIYRDFFGNNNPVLIFLGRLTPVKQLDMVIKAIAHLKNKGETYNLVFVGDGEMRQSLEALAANMNVQNQVWFYGACYDEKKNAELVYNADLCVAPGNIGLTAMHSLMFGCPVLTHDCLKWQMPEFESVRPNRTGLFFKYQNQNDLEYRISEWFRVNAFKRNIVRKNCYYEIDTQWNPQFQLDVIKKVLQID